ncbi:MAG TPA: outer membrane beta-barrel protein [Bacteroidota bacterium]|nr:outer membrane beta-barrel protein [Bacteroidota bacterium]
MKKTVLVLTGLLFVAAAALQAQDYRTTMRAGARSLNFTFGGFGTFGFTGSGVSGGLGYSYFPSAGTAYRIGLQAVYNHTTTPWNDNTTAGTNPGTDGTNSTLGLGAGFDYLMYWDGISARLRPYWGPGISVIYNMSSVKPPVSNNAPGGTTLETRNGNTNDGATVAVMWALGAEFFIYPELSVSAEYQLNLISITSRSDRVIVTKNNPDFTSKQGSSYQILGVGAAGATIHFYF